MPRSPLTEQIPEYLQPYIVRQDPSLYAPIDHASWRFILKISRAFFAGNAHQKYLDGLQETGISTERIPLISEMDQCLRRFGWRAVAVSGFLPPAVFMEFQSLGVLPIACDMRKLEHLAYTPAPDIVHEAAGHAPIIADPEYSAYLRSYGELSRKAIFSHQDMDVYNAIRDLSDIKEDPSSTPATIEAAQKRLDDALAAVTFVSEATLLSRMGWWTFEYGLVGSLEHPKIYGAGLLSSVGESYHCLSDEVRKIPFSMACIQVTYDITRPQPQLFVAESFQQLTDALEELAGTMAFRHGGIRGLDKAVQARSLTTTTLDSGLQISGVLARALRDGAGEAAYLSFSGPTQLAHEDQELPKQGADYHKEGFGSPLGRLKELGKPASLLKGSELAALGCAPGKAARLEFESGVLVEGRFRSKVEKEGRILLLAFEDCTVRLGGEILFRPEWGTFDMACGEKAVSVFGGAADRRRYLAVTGGYKQAPGRQKTNLTDENRVLNALYARVRALREGGKAGEGAAELAAVHAELEKNHPDDWLLRYELLELNAAHRLGAPWEKTVRARLDAVAAGSRQTAEMIQRGLALL